MYERPHQVSGAHATTLREMDHVGAVRGDYLTWAMAEAQRQMEVEAIEHGWVIDRNTIIVRVTVEGRAK